MFNKFKSELPNVNPIPSEKVLKEALEVKRLPYNKAIFNELLNYTQDNQLTNLELLLTTSLEDYYYNNYKKMLIYKLQKNHDIESEDFPISCKCMNSETDINNSIIFVNGHINNAKYINTNLVYGFKSIKDIYECFGSDHIKILQQNGWGIYCYNVLIKK